MLSIVWMWRKLTEITARICAHIKFNAFSRYSGKGLTPRITGKIKLQSEAAQLYFVRVYAIVRHFN